MFRLTSNARQVARRFREEKTRVDQAGHKAFRSTAFWLMTQTRKLLRAGVDPEKSPLTRRLARRGGKRALAAFAPMVAYEVTKPRGREREAKIGLSAAGKRRQRVIPLELARQVSAGRQIRVDRDLQEAIAAKLRAKGRKRLDKAIPEAGQVLSVPQRPWVARVERLHGPRAHRILAELYRRNLKGQRAKVEDVLGEGKI